MHEHCPKSEYLYLIWVTNEKRKVILIDFFRSTCALRGRLIQVRLRDRLPPPVKHLYPLGRVLFQDDNPSILKAQQNGMTMKIMWIMVNRFLPNLESPIMDLRFIQCAPSSKHQMNIFLKNCSLFPEKFYSFVTLVQVFGPELWWHFSSVLTCHPSVYFPSFTHTFYWVSENKQKG